MIPGVSFDGGNQDSGYVQPSNPSNPDNPDVPVNPQVAGDCITALQTMANWYLANVTTYQAGPITNGNRTRKNYSWVCQMATVCLTKLVSIFWGMEKSSLA